jgi:hypothetical protein
MTAEPTITCPKCKTEIKLTESLAAPLIEATKRAYEQEMAEKDAAVAQKEKALREKEAAIAKEREAIEEQVADKVREERTKIAEEEARKARKALTAEFEEKDKEAAELKEALERNNEKLAAAQKAQAELIRKERELADAKREIELTIEQRVQESLATTREQAKKEAEDSLKLKVAEKEQTISSMQKQIEDLKRRAEQGSQQLQGEVQELEIEALLREKFPLDVIEPVPKGEHGGDALQRVTGPAGQACGTIIWETKRTKNWSDGWLTKLRDDQRAAKAEIAVMMSQALPKGVEAFDLVDGVWVTHPRTALPLAMTLRNTLIELSSARMAVEGQLTKTEMIYHYLTGPRFKQRVEAIVEAFSSMEEDLNKERKMITKQWAKREEQINRVMQSTVGMYGDLQGIAGKSLQEIEGLEMKALGTGGEEAE